jgi:hypothetical protein
MTAPECGNSSPETLPPHILSFPGESAVLPALRVCKSKGMFKAQVEDNALLSSTWTDSDRKSQPWDDLQTTAQIVRPAHAGAYVQVLGPLCLPRSNHLFARGPEGFDQKIHARSRQPHHGLTKIHADDVGAVTALVKRTRNPSRANIPVGDEMIRMLDADGQVCLPSETTCSSPEFVIASGSIRLLGATASRVSPLPTS